MIDPTIQNAISASLQAFAAYTPVNVEELQTKITDVFILDEDFLEKVDALDEVFDEYPQIESLQTICSKMNHLGGKHCYPLANRSVARMSWSSIPGSE